MFASIFIVWAVIGVVASLMLVRNNRAWAIRNKALKRFDDSARRDIASGHEWRWRHTAWDTLGYDQVMYSVFKWRVDDFYDAEGVPHGYPRPEPTPYYMKLEVGNRNA